MVGRLIEKQDIGLRRHRLGKGSAAGLAAGKIIGLLLAGEAEVFEQIGDAVRIICRPESCLYIGAHGGETFHVWRLRQVADSGGRLAKQLAILRLDHAGGDLEQRRFAGTVAADKRDLVAGRCRKRSAVKQRNAAEGELDVVEPKQRGWRHGGLEFRTGERMSDQHGASAE